MRQLGRTALISTFVGFAAALLAGCAGTSYVHSGDGADIRLTPGGTRDGKTVAVVQATDLNNRQLAFNGRNGRMAFNFSEGGSVWITHTNGHAAQQGRWWIDTSNKLCVKQFENWPQGQCWDLYLDPTNHVNAVERVTASVGVQAGSLYNPN